MMIIQKCSIVDIDDVAFRDGKLRAVPYNDYKQFGDNVIKYFMYFHGIYCLPTTELIDFTRELLIGSAIEIGAGNGIFGRDLNIKMTDSFLQAEASVKAIYEMANQPTINYPDDIERMSADTAVFKYKPDTVVGAYITHKWMPGLPTGNQYGVDLVTLLNQVKRFIHVGNLFTHQHSPLLHVKHKAFAPNWLITRSTNQTLNRIWVWTKES